MPVPYDRFSRAGVQPHPFAHPEPAEGEMGTVASPGTTQRGVGTTNRTRTASPTDIVCSDQCAPQAGVLRAGDEAGPRVDEGEATITLHTGFMQLGRRH